MARQKTTSVPSVSPPSPGAQVSRHYKSLIPVGQPLQLPAPPTVNSMPDAEQIDQALLQVLTKEEALVIVRMRMAKANAGAHGALRRAESSHASEDEPDWVVEHVEKAKEEKAAILAAAAAASDSKTAPAAEQMPPAAAAVAQPGRPAQPSGPIVEGSQRRSSRAAASVSYNENALATTGRPMWNNANGVPGQHPKETATQYRARLAKVAEKKKLPTGAREEQAEEDSIAGSATETDATDQLRRTAPQPQKGSGTRVKLSGDPAIVAISPPAQLKPLKSKQTPAASPVDEPPVAASTAAAATAPISLPLPEQQMQRRKRNPVCFNENALAITGRPMWCNADGVPGQHPNETDTQYRARLAKVAEKKKQQQDLGAAAPQHDRTSAETEAVPTPSDDASGHEQHGVSSAPRGKQGMAKGATTANVPTAVTDSTTVTAAMASAAAALFGNQSPTKTTAPAEMPGALGEATEALVAPVSQRPRKTAPRAAVPVATTQRRSSRAAASVSYNENTLATTGRPMWNNANGVPGQHPKETATQYQARLAKVAEKKERKRLGLSELPAETEKQKKRKQPKAQGSGTAAKRKQNKANLHGALSQEFDDDGLADSSAHPSKAQQCPLAAAKTGGAAVADITSKDGAGTAQKGAICRQEPVDIVDDERVVDRLGSQAGASAHGGAPASPKMPTNEFVRHRDAKDEAEQQGAARPNGRGKQPRKAMAKPKVDKRSKYLQPKKRKQPTAKKPQDAEATAPPQEDDKTADGSSDGSLAKQAQLRQLQLQQQQRQREEAVAHADEIRLHQRREEMLKLINESRLASGSPLLDGSQESIALVDRYLAENDRLAAEQAELDARAAHETQGEDVEVVMRMRSADSSWVWMPGDGNSSDSALHTSGNASKGGSAAAAAAASAPAAGRSPPVTGSEGGPESTPAPAAIAAAGPKREAAAVVGRSLTEPEPKKARTLGKAVAATASHSGSTASPSLSPSPSTSRQQRPTPVARSTARTSDASVATPSPSTLAAIRKETEKAYTFGSGKVVARGSQAAAQKARQRRQQQRQHLAAQIQRQRQQQQTLNVFTANHARTTAVTVPSPPHPQSVSAVAVATESPAGQASPPPRHSTAFYNTAAKLPQPAVSQGKPSPRQQQGGVAALMDEVADAC